MVSTLKLRSDGVANGRNVQALRSISQAKDTVSRDLIIRPFLSVPLLVWRFNVFTPSSWPSLNCNIVIDATLEAVNENNRIFKELEAKGRKPRNMVSRAHKSRKSSTPYDQ